jgi:branched-chain amino acid transport system permease protein
MDVLIQQLVNGLTLGFVYALVALGVTMIFGTLEIVAFAQGGVYMVGAYAGYWTAGHTQQFGWPVALPLALFAGAVSGGALNVVIDRLAYWPIRQANKLSALITGIGAYIFIENGMGAVMGRRVMPYPSVLPSTTFTLGPVHVTLAQLIVVGLCVVAMASLWFLVRRTAIGLLIRAVAERSETAGLMAIDAEKVIMLTFASAGAFSGVAGVLVGGFVGIVSPTMGFLVGIKAFAAAIIAGIGNVPGALLGGLVVGMTETLSAGYLPSGWSDAVVFVMLVIVLVVRPSGLLGAVIPNRA